MVLSVATDVVVGCANDVPASANWTLYELGEPVAGAVHESCMVVAVIVPNVNDNGTDGTPDVFTMTTLTLDTVVDPLTFVAVDLNERDLPTSATRGVYVPLRVAACTDVLSTNHAAVTVTGRFDDADPNDDATTAVPTVTGLDMSGKAVKYGNDAIVSATALMACEKIGRAHV